jgi:G-patch domain
MHPNWKALASVYIPRQTFVSASSKKTTPPDSTAQNSTFPSNFQSYKEYQSIIESTPSSSTGVAQPAVTRSKSKLSAAAIPFNQNLFFKAAMANDCATIRNMFRCQTTVNTSVNAVDSFGWSALMMAACENATEAVVLLLELGADRDYIDAKGHSALSLAKAKNYGFVVQELTKPRHKEEAPPETTHKNEPFFCKLCKREFKETSEQSHRASTVHQFNYNRKRGLKTTTYYGLPDTHKGFQMLLRQGWDREKGLGPRQDGQQFPVKTVLRKRGAGLGIQQDPARVTHFGMYDTEAVRRRWEPVAKKPLTKKDMLRNISKDKRKEMKLRQELS